MKEDRKHRWIALERREDRAICLPEAVPGRVFVMQSHRLLRGPYTAAGSLLRQLVPVVLERWPELVERHVVEILSLAPELRAVVPASRETLTSLAIPEERTRFYSRLRTMRLANGVIDFLKKLTRHDRLGPLQLVFEDAGACEGLDGEFLAALLRRMPPEQAEITLGTRPHVEQPLVREAALRYAERTDAPSGTGERADRRGQGLLPLAERFVRSDGTSDCPEELAAYKSMSESVRKALHDLRADELSESDERSWKLGAIPWHRERGSSKARAVEALRFALDTCIDMGFYEATVDFGYRGRRLVDWSEPHIENMWAFTTKATNSLAALGRPEEAEMLYDEARANTDAEGIHMQAAYATAMLYTRHHASRDHGIARQWMEKALAYAAKIGDEKQRAFRTVFYNNGLALVEMHEGRMEEALRLVTEGEAWLNERLGAGEQMLHRSVLIHNKAQILVAMGRHEEALIEYDRVIEIDPNYPEYHFDRGNLLSRMGRLEEAVACYAHALEISPPFPEVCYNRAAAHNRLGDAERALADLDYLLEIEPAHLDGRLNRATLRLEAGDPAGARADVEEGLALEPQNAQLLCTLGLIEMAEERPEEAKRALMAALAVDASLLEAHVNLSVLLFEGDDKKGAVEALNRALAQHPQADVLYFNRAWALQALGRWEEAVADYTRALQLGSEEAQEILAQREACLLELGRG